MKQVALFLACMALWLGWLANTRLDRIDHCGDAFGRPCDKPYHLGKPKETDGE